MEDSSRQVREVPRLASLATRSAALYSALVGAAVVLAGWLIYSGNRDEVLAGRERDLKHRARTVQVRIETEVRAVANDVQFLTQARFLRRLADSWDQARPPADLVADVQGTFAALLEGKPSYAQTRLLRLSDEGEEIIRLDHVAGRVVACPPEDLQAKGHRDYFRESADLKPGELYLSRINLNREFGGISTPRTPTLRVAGKVFDSAGTPFGLVVINVDLRTLFTQLQAAAGAEASLYIANRDGDYLVHPNPAKTFGFDLGSRYRVQDDFGADAVNSPQNAREVVRFVAFPMMEEADESLLVGVSVPRETVLSELTAIRNRSLAAALTAGLLAAALVWGLAFLLSRRLTALADAIGHYEPGTGPPALPERGRDEVAVVARKFSVLSAKIDEQVNALEQARHLAEENRRAKEEFLATLSHEIRTPMNAVTGLLHALATDRPARHQQATLEALQFASRKLIAVVNDVLDFSKIEAGRITFERAPFDLPELLDSVRTGHLNQAREGGIDFSVQCADPVPRFVGGDSLRLYQILNNLVQNALRFTPPDGRVTVTVARRNDGRADAVALSFTVQDTGVGMTDEELGKALLRFGQARPGTSHKFGGTGLGLPIARMLVELQGGRFEAQSTPGLGSRFRFDLDFEPASKGTAPESRPLATAPDLSGARILCVEDVASNRQVVSALLSPSGATLDFATNAAETIAQLEGAHAECPPDLVLLDLQLPDRDGADLARELRARWPEIPIVGLTAQTAGALLERCRQAGVTTFLWKPIDPERFFPTIATALTSSPPGAECSHDRRAPRESHAASVLALFDGNPERTARYLLTLAGELDEAAAALPDLAARSDLAGLRALHHRLRNGLTLVEADSVLEALDRLSSRAAEAPPWPEQLVHECCSLLAETASKLRASSPDEAVPSTT